MQRLVLSLLFAAVAILLLAAVLLALLPDQPELAGWRSVNDEVAVLLDGDVVAGGHAGKAEQTPTGKADHPSAEKETGPGQININKATAEQLVALPGIGPAKAGAIVTYRETYGSFETLEQLMEVKGIGPKTFERLKDLIEL